ncbi:MAG: hypothetical protein ACP5VQ_11760, partial [Phycisphaerae bacterium]
MDSVTESHIQQIEKELSARLVEQFHLSLRTLTYDGTNFFTYIRTQTPATLPQRGHNKQKRGDLRQVSLGMLVSTDFHIPLFHNVNEQIVLAYRAQHHIEHAFRDMKNPHYLGWSPMF